MSVKVFDLQCEHGHAFEGWFASLDDYTSQHERRFITCPMCNSDQVARQVSASRINTRRASQKGEPSSNATATAVAADSANSRLMQLQADMMRHLRTMVRATDDVGAEFAREARRMHYGEVPERAIRGTATPEERESMDQDGITVMPIPGFLDDDSLQ